jgi:hypothetical protein
MNIYTQPKYIQEKHDKPCDAKIYSNDVENENGFIYLFKMMHEYKRLELHEKTKYMNILTEWYMREKDTLNILYNKDKS